jgi:hypothetical protein
VPKPCIRVAHASQSRNDIADAIACWLAHAIAAGGESAATSPGLDVEALLIGGGVDAVAMIGIGAGAGGNAGTP